MGLRAGVLFPFLRSLRLRLSQSDGPLHHACRISGASQHGKGADLPPAGREGGKIPLPLRAVPNGGRAPAAAAKAAASASRASVRSSAQASETFVGRDLGKAEGTAVGIAMQYRGVKYKWGGSTPSGFDCSGFVSYVYAQLGKSVPHSSAEISRMGTSLPLSQAQPGDILWHPGHVAIYVGGGKIIHAPKPGDRVKVAPIYRGTWKTIRL